MSVQDALDWDPSRIVVKGRAERLPTPSWIEAASANWRLNQDDSQDYQMLHQVEAYQGLEDALVAMGRPKARYHNPDWNSFLHPDGWDQRKVQLWTDVSEARRLNPKAFADLPATQQEFETWAARRKGERDRDQKVAALGGTGSMLAPSLGFGLLRMPEPENLLQLPMGGGARTVAGTLLSQFAAGAVGTVATTPERVQARAAMGEGYSGNELALDAGIGGLANAGMVAGHMGAVKAGQLAMDQVPLDYRLARALKQQNPRHVRSPELQSAIDVVVRGYEVDQTSPYVGTLNAGQSHVAKLQAAMTELESLPVAVPTRPVAPLASPSVAATVGTRSAVNLDQALGFIINRLEGGDKLNTDTGGLTKYGISAKGNPGIDIAALTESQARAIYRRKYVGALDLQGQSGEAALVAIDASINHGPDFAKRLLREAGNDPAKMIALRRGEYARLIREAPEKYGKYAKGWENRLQQVEQQVGLRPGEAGTEMAVPEPDAVTIPDRPAALDAERPEVVREEVLQPALLDAARQLVADRSHSLHDLPALAEGLGVGEQDLRAAMDRLVGQGELRQLKSGAYRRVAVPGDTGPEDMLRFIARRGGLAYDGFSEAQRIRNLKMENPPKGHNLRDSGNLNHFVPGAGPLLRPGGLGLDDMGELLHDAGYFGPPEVTPRPTEAELLTLLDGVIGRKEKRLSFFDQAKPEAIPTVKAQQAEEARLASEGEAAGAYLARRDHWDRAADRLGLVGLFPEDIRKIEALMQSGTDNLPPLDHTVLPSEEELAPYIVEMVNREIDSALEDAYLEIEDPLYDHAPSDSAGRQDRSPDQGGGGQAADGGNAGESGAGAGSGPTASGGAAADALEAEGLAGPVLTDPVTAARFDEPDGDGVKAAADSVWHDLRAGEDPNIAALNKQRAQLGAEAPMRGKAEQDGTMGSPLFDAVDQPKFDLGDGRGERTIAEIDAELKAAEQGIANIRDCML